MKPFEYASDSRFQKIYNFRKILSTNEGSGIICITGKTNVIVNKSNSAINIINKMGPKIGPSETPKSMFRKSLNSEPNLVFCFLLQRQPEIKDSDFLSKPKAFNFAISKP